jgi:hypothetical protein
MAKGMFGRRMFIWPRQSESAILQVCDGPISTHSPGTVAMPLCSGPKAGGPESHSINAPKRAPREPSGWRCRRIHLPELIARSPE